jgi:hypothetical protein
MRAHRLTNEELDDLANQIVRGETYFASPNAGGAFQHAFGHFFLLMDEDLTQSQIESIGGCYAPMSDASPRGINGYPFFLKMHLLHVDDVVPLHKRVMSKQDHLNCWTTWRRLLRWFGLMRAEEHAPA